MNKEILVFDVEDNGLGIYSVTCDEYILYIGKDRIKAVERLIKAKEIISYNGNRYDLVEISKYCGLHNDELIKIEGVHTDMIEICWPGIRGSSLRNTYLRIFEKETLQRFSGRFDNSNECDCYMTFKLWETWKNDTLRL